LIGSVLLIEAKNMEEAIQIASLYLTTQAAEGEEYGWRMEVRPVHYFEEGK
jgi:hypothetical protein